MRRTLILVSLAVLAAAAGLSARAEPPSIVVEHPWSRPAPQGRTSVIYMTITEHGQPDRLIGISTPVAEKAEVHETTNDGGVMRMRPVDGIAIASDRPVTLAPGGYHVMLFGLKQPLVSGATFPATLIFAHAGAIPATVTVEQGQGGAPAMNPAMHSGMQPGMQMDGPHH